MGASDSATWAKLVITVFIVLAVIAVVLLAIVIARTKSTAPGVPGGPAGGMTAVTYGAHYILAGDGDRAVGVDTTNQLIPATPTGQPGPAAYDATNVVRVFSSKDPLATTVRDGDAVRLLFPLTGRWFSADVANVFTTPDYAKATDVVVQLATPPTGVQPQGGAAPVHYGDRVVFFSASNTQKTRGPDDVAFALLGQTTGVRFSPAGVFGAGGIAGC